MKNTVFKMSAGSTKALDKKVQELLEICQIEHLPMFLSVAVENTDETTTYKNVVYGAKSHNMGLADDRIEKHILIANGFDAVPKRENVILDALDTEVL